MGGSEGAAEGNYLGLRCAACIETRLTGSSDMKRLIHCQWPWWRMTLLHLKPLWIYQSNLACCIKLCERIENRAAWLCVSMTRRFNVCTWRCWSKIMSVSSFDCKQGQLLHCNDSCHSSLQRGVIAPAQSSLTIIILVLICSLSPLCSSNRIHGCSIGESCI